MTKNQLKLASALLELASKQFSNHGCNDLSEDITDLLSQSEWDELNKEFHDWNGDPENYEPNDIMHYDWLWMNYMSKKLKDLSND